MSTTNTPKAPQPEFNTLNALAKKYEEEVAKIAGTCFAPEELAKKKAFTAFLAEKIPVKSHVLGIFNGLKTRRFLVSEFLSQYNETKKTKEPDPVFTPEKLLKKIGYSLSKTRMEYKEKDVYRIKGKPKIKGEPKIEEAFGIASFAHFYKKGERICTMLDTNKILDCNYFLFLTHKNAANIPHANDLDANNLTPEWEQYLKKNGITDINGISPQHEDPYGLSVLCVQINIETGTVLKIINRYNHSVKNPEFTFAGNLNKLTPGLEQAIYLMVEYERNLSFEQQKTERPKNLIEEDGKFYLATQEQDGVYWGDGFVYNNGKVTVADPSSERVVDGYILSLKERKPDHFPKDFNDPYLEGIKQVKFTSEDTMEVVDNQGKKATLKTKDGCLISFHSDELTEMEDNFLCYNNTLESLTAPNLKTAGYNCLGYNNALTVLSCDNLEEVKDDFCYSNNSITSLSLNSLKKVSPGFFESHRSLKRLFPKDLSNGICVSLENKAVFKNIQPQKIQETAPSGTPSGTPPNGTFPLNGPGNLINEGKDGKNGSGK